MNWPKENRKLRNIVLKKATNNLCVHSAMPVSAVWYVKSSRQRSHKYSHQDLRKKEKYLLSGRGVIVSVRWAGGRVREAADLLGFSCTAAEHNQNNERVSEQQLPGQKRHVDVRGWTDGFELQPLG